MINYKKLSIREKQAIGALCILFFCKKYMIKHKGLFELNNHLLNLLVNKDIISWNNEGVKLEIVGRGEPFPESLNKMLSNDIKDVFYNLIDNVVEIGIVDLFGDFTDEPNYFLGNALKILKQQKINFDFPSYFFTELNKEAWGEPWTESKYINLRNYIDMIYDEDYNSQ